jgi:hypothetical protein
LKIPFQHVAVAAGVLAFAGAGTALAHGDGHGNDHKWGPTGSSGPSGPTGPSGDQKQHRGHYGNHKHFRFHRKHKANYVFSGTWTSADSSVSVTGGNAKVRKAGFVGQSVKFDTTKTHVLVFDTNGDSDTTLADVKDGDTVLVLARLPKDGSATQPFQAAKLLDATNLPSFGGGWEG